MKLNFKILTIALFVFAATLPQISVAQTAAKGGRSGLENTVVAEVGPEKIRYSDLERAFKKNMNRQNQSLYQSSRDSVLEFLELYVNYRLKVLDAIDRGYEKDSAVIADIDQNRQILAETFFYDKKLTEPNVELMLERRKKDLQIAIIHVAWDPKTQDTAAAKAKAEEALAKIKAGEDFAAVAKAYSDDDRTKENGGRLESFLTAGATPKDIENAMYSLKPGETCDTPIQTGHGFLIIKLLREEPRQRIYARHILLSEGFDEDSAAVVKKADSLINALKSGADFARLAEKFSDDIAGAKRGGELRDYYSRSGGFAQSGRRLTPEFEETLFDLKDGELSGPVITEYGVHIIRRDSSSPFPESEDREELKKTYKRNSLQRDMVVFNDSLRKAYDYKLNTSVFDRFFASLDTNKNFRDPTWSADVPDDLKAETLFSVNGKSYDVAYAIDEMKKSNDLRLFNFEKDQVKTAVESVADDVVFGLASAGLEKEYPEFAALIKEFRDGILLFKVEREQVWDKLKFDTVAAKEYFGALDKKYYTDPSYKLLEIHVLNEDLANELYERAEEGESFEDLASKYTERKGFREKKGDWGFVSVDNNDLGKIVSQKGASEGDILKPFEIDEGYSIVKVVEYRGSREKTFEEAIPEFAQEFQDYYQKKLTEEWLSEVRKKHAVKIHKDKLYEVIETLRDEN